MPIRVIKSGFEEIYYKLDNLIDDLEADNEDFVCSTCLHAIDELREIQEIMLEEK